MQVMLSLSDEQIKDILLLQRMYFAQRCQLDAQRAALIAQMQEQSPNPIANAARTSALAAEVCANAAEDSKLLRTSAAAVYCGVSQHFLHYCTGQMENRTIARQL